MFKQILESLAIRLYQDLLKCPSVQFLVVMGTKVFIGFHKEIRLLVKYRSRPMDTKMPRRDKFSEQKARICEINFTNSCHEKVRETNSYDLNLDVCLSQAQCQHYTCLRQTHALVTQLNEHREQRKDYNQQQVLLPFMTLF